MGSPESLLDDVFEPAMYQAPGRYSLIQIKRSRKPAPVQVSAILSSCRLFSRLSGGARDALANMGKLSQVEPSAVVFRQGNPCPGMFVVGAGLVRLYKLAPNGKEHVLHLAGPGATFAEAAMLGGFPCPATAEAVEQSTLLLLPTAPFLHFLRSDHEACIDLLAGMSGWLHHVVDLLEDVVLRDAAGRVARHLLALSDENGRVRLPAARKMLANQMNLTPETLSRTLRRLDDEGAISSERDAIVVRDRERLGAVAEGLYPLM